MELNNMRLGSLIEPFDERCAIASLTAKDISGINATKEFFEPARQVGKDTSNYRNVPPGFFACNLMHVGRDAVLPIALNRSSQTKIVSPAYSVFRLKPKSGVLNEYFFMTFNSPERDRYFWFHTDASVRDGMSWFDFCECMVSIPELSIQRKYVAVYEAMLANQRMYEKGLADLKLTCDILLDRCKTSERWMRVGDCVEEVDRRNLDISCDMAFGININKQFMASKVSSDDLHNYKLVAPGELAYSSMQTGRDKCIRIALHEGHEDIAVSPAYSILQEKSDSMLPIKYLMMWFSRPEMDRLGWFLSDASIRANLDLSEFLNIKIPVPDKPVQEAVVKIYDAWKTRTGINGRMKKRLKDICPILVKGSIEEARR